MAIPVTTGAKKGNGITLEYDFGDTLQDMVNNFGEQMVYDRALRSFKISFQSWVTAQLEAGKTEDQIKAEAAQWKPGQRKAAKSPQEKLQEMLEKLSPQERQAFFKEHRPGKSAA